MHRSFCHVFLSARQSSMFVLAKPSLLSTAPPSNPSRGDTVLPQIFNRGIKGFSWQEAGAAPRMQLLLWLAGNSLPRAAESSPQSLLVFIPSAAHRLPAVHGLHPQPALLLRQRLHGDHPGPARGSTGGKDEFFIRGRGEEDKLLASTRRTNATGVPAGCRISRRAEHSDNPQFWGFVHELGAKFLLWPSGRQLTCTGSGRPWNSRRRQGGDREGDKGR